MQITAQINPCSSHFPATEKKAQTSEVTVTSGALNLKINLMMLQETSETSEFPTTVVFSCCFVTKINRLFFSANSTELVFPLKNLVHVGARTPKQPLRWSQQQRCLEVVLCGVRRAWEVTASTVSDGLPDLSGIFSGETGARRCCVTQQTSLMPVCHLIAALRSLMAGLSC